MRFMGQVWYLIVSIPDICHLSYFVYMFSDICLFLAVVLPLPGCNFHRCILGKVESLPTQ